MLNESIDRAQAYGRHRAELSADELVAIGLPIVRRIAFRMVRRLPNSIEVDDLISAGTEGLLKAIGAYDASCNPNFEPYAKARIRGAILDELRGHDSLTRYGRNRMGEVTAAIRALQNELGRQPTEEEVAARLGMPLEQYQRISGELARGPALGRLGGAEPDQVEADTPTPSALFDRAELKAELTRAISLLPERQQQVLALYYQEECTQAEIGKILGVTESRVCQILGDITVRLRAAMNVDAPPATRKHRATKNRKAS
ncbi:MAG: RNA polymerase sigma factor FliA [Myxococcales bacterium]|nr:RNA polymerase sigma factor FliA [Myxococcales bacterium]